MPSSPSAAGAMAQPETVDGFAPVPASERIAVLDVLRGIALLGMFLVHFSSRSSDPGSGLGHIYSRGVELFFVNRFFTIFAILFGVGFAVLLRRAEAGGSTFMPRYVRRLLALAVFGFVAEVLFGFNALLGYAIWGMPLLLVRRWSTKALVLLLLLCTMSPSIVLVVRATYATATGRAAQFAADRENVNALRIQALRTAGSGARATDYQTVVAARLRVMRVRYSQEGFLVPAGAFTLFLLGFLGLRVGLFEDPRRHRRLIAGIMLFGVATWAVWEWLYPLQVTIPPGWPLPLRALSGFATTQPFAIGSFSADLAFTYIGGVLLLVAHYPVWLRRLSAFAITGRMALTNYMLQVAILDITFANHGFALKVSAGYAPLAALALFAVDVALSRWWLSRYQYGPLEWLWRSATYARWQPTRRLQAVGAS